MLYTSSTKRAIKIMFDAHKDQVDKSGMPYVFHPWHVAEQMEDENTTIVALLHDVVEDTEMTFSDLEKFGFSNEVIEALKLLTHKPEVDYFEYIEGLSDNAIATRVKMADLQHNMDLSRLSTVTEKDVKRYEKYERCYNYLAEKSQKKL